MAEDNTDRADEHEAEREAAVEEELERIDRGPEEVDDGDAALGTQNAPREDAVDDLEDAESDIEQPE